MAATDSGNSVPPAAQLPSNVLYDDEHVQLTDTHVIVKSYYFPFATAKRIAYADIEYCKRDVELSLNLLEKKAWGMGLSDIWWAWGGFSRPDPDLVIKVRDAWPCVGFSTKDVKRFRDILATKGVNGCMKSEL